MSDRIHNGDEMGDRSYVNDTLLAAQLDEWFRYHEPTPETSPKYARIREGEQKLLSALQAAFYEIRTKMFSDKTSLYAVCNEETKRFALLILELCPEGEDRRAAIEHVRMARHAFNEYVAVTNAYTEGRAFVDLGTMEVVKARWKANSAIACAPVKTSTKKRRPPPARSAVSPTP